MKDLQAEDERTRTRCDLISGTMMLNKSNVIKNSNNKLIFTTTKSVLYFLKIQTTHYDQLVHKVSRLDAINVLPFCAVNIISTHITSPKVTISFELFPTMQNAPIVNDYHFSHV